MKAERLTEKQRRFVEAYMGKAAGNATEAARLAGYKGNNNTLRVVGSENLAKPAIAMAVGQRQKADPLIADRTERQRFWTRVMRGEERVRKFLKIDGETVEVEVDPDYSDRLKAAELLGKASGDFVQRVAVGGDTDLPPVGVVLYIPDDGSGGDG